MNLFKILFSILTIVTLGFSNNLVQKDLNDKSFSINKGSFKVVEFDKMVKNIKVSDGTNIEIDFVENDDKPLQSIKILAKEIGHGNVLVDFVDSSKMHLDINITENFYQVKQIAKKLSPNLEISQVNGKIILEGKIPNQKIKDSILRLLGIQVPKKNTIINPEETIKVTTEGTNTADNLIDLSIIENPDKMIRLKLFIVEIDNNKGETYKNDWSFYSFDDGKTSIDYIGNDSSNLSLSGGLAAIANRIGSKFNVGLTLQYLQEKQIVQVLDETTLITLEDNTSKFHSGGTINARVATGDTVQFKEITYGLKMAINVEEVIDNKYIKLIIDTESSTLDTSFTVDQIPGIKNKTITTNIVIGNLSTVVLGGLININSEKAEEKIPLLGDIPILGKVFTSSSNTIDNKELVFFITPEIVDPKNNNQINLFKEKTTFINDLEINKKTQKKAAEKITKKQNIRKEESTNELSEHQKRVKEILGY